MVNRDEYDRVVESFMMEMPGVCITHSEAVLRKLPHLGPELDEYIALLRDPNLSPGEVLRTAFGLIDEFVRDTWESTMSESYALYADLARGSSESGPRAT
jgi:hypothetical protein